MVMYTSDFESRMGLSWPVHSRAVCVLTSITRKYVGSIKMNIFRNQPNTIDMIKLENLVSGEIELSNSLLSGIFGTLGSRYISASTPPGSDTGTASIHVLNGMRTKQPHTLPWVVDPGEK